MPNCYILKGPLPYYQTKHTRNQQLKTFFKDQSHSSPLFVKTFPSHDNDHSDYSVSPFLSKNFRSMGRGPYGPGPSQARQRSRGVALTNRQCLPIKFERIGYLYVCLFIENNRNEPLMILVVQTG